MTSKHYKWQTRWRHDTAAGAWVHECGLRVRCAPGGQPQALNAPETLAALLPVHGGHNAPAMLARLQREAQQLAAQPLARATP